VVIMADDPDQTPRTSTSRAVQLDRTKPGVYLATNTRGGTITVGSGDDDAFSPVELLLAAIGGCTAIDADAATSRHAEPTQFSLTITGDKTTDETGGNRMVNLAVTYHVSFPDDAEGNAARAILPRAVKLSHDRLCTVSRTIESGTPVTLTIADDATAGA
jgi:putative redox protein